MFQQSIRSGRTARSAGLALSGLALSGLALAALASPLRAATELLGGGYLVGYGDSCAEHGWGGTHQLLARMAPQGAAGNPENETQMALLLATGTIAFSFDNHGSYRQAQRLSRATYVWNGPWSPEEPTMAFMWNYYGDIPGANDRELGELILDFYNFNEHPGCNMSAYLVLRRN